MSKKFVFVFVFVGLIFGATIVGGASSLEPASTSDIAVAEPVEVYAGTSDIYAAGPVVVEIEKYVNEIERARIEEARKVASAKAAVKTTVSYVSVGTGSVWDDLSVCETGGNWSANTGNGFGGGLQFMHQSSYSTWLSFGGGDFAPNPWDASREQQIVIAEKVLASSGWNAWPGCSSKLGLR